MEFCIVKYSLRKKFIESSGNGIYAVFTDVNNKPLFKNDKIKSQIFDCKKITNSCE